MSGPHSYLKHPVPAECLKKCPLEKVIPHCERTPTRNRTCGREGDASGARHLVSKIQ